jgi:hypothetical protein
MPRKEKTLLREALTYAAVLTGCALLLRATGKPVVGRYFILGCIGCAVILADSAAKRRARRRPVFVGTYTEVKKKIRDGTGEPYTRWPKPEFRSLPVAQLFALTDERAFQKGLLDHLLAKRYRSREGTITPTEVALLDVSDLRMEVDNGGFDQYFFNSSGDRAYAVVAALERIGAPRAADIARRSLTVFPRSAPARVREERWEQTDAWTQADKDLLWALGKELFESSEDLDPLVAAYARAHRREFSDVVEAAEEGQRPA